MSLQEPALIQYVQCCIRLTDHVEAELKTMKLPVAAPGLRAWNTRRVAWQTWPGTQHIVVRVLFFSGFCPTKAIFTLSRLHLSLEMAVTYESCQPVVFTHVLSDRTFCELLLVSHGSSHQQLLMLGWTSKPWYAPSYIHVISEGWIL